MKARLALVVAVVVAVVAFWWLRRKDEEVAAPPPTVAAKTKPVPVADAPLGTLTVVVKDASGPIANANVRIDELVRTTNASGVASAALPAGEYAISASAENHLPAMRKLALPSGGAQVELMLAVGGRPLAGKVTDAGGGAIANARIEAVKLGANAKPDGAIATAITGADGTYKLTAPLGPLLVGAAHDDYAPQSRYVDGPTANFALVPGGSIEGIVRDARTKQPVAKAKVIARRDDPTLALAEPAAHAVVARDDGTFRIAGLRPGAYELAVPGGTREPTRVGLGVAEQLTGVEILVDPALPVVRGTVRDEHDAPVAHATVTAFGMRGGEATSGDDGAFAMTGLPAGRHMLIAGNDTHVADRATPVEVASQDVVGVVIHVRGGARIAGHVEPRQPCEVRLAPDDDAMMHGAMPSILAPIATDDRGEFVIAPVMPGAARLTARCASGAQGALETVAPDQKSVVAVAEGGAIAGRAVDGKHAGIAGVTVVAAMRGDTQRVEVVNGTLVSGVQAMTGSDGSFVVVGLAPGTYALSVLDRGHPLRMVKAPAPVVIDKQRVDGVELVADRATGVIRGVVIGPDGKPLADAWVSAKQTLSDLIDGAMDKGEGSRMVTVQSDDSGGDTELPPALTDANGKFELAGLPHVKYQVVAEAQAGALRDVANGVLPDATLTLHPQALTSLTGTVRGPTGPAKLFSVELTGPATLQRSFTDGTFSFQRVDPGEYRVHVTSSEGNADGVAKVEPGHMASIDLVLSANAVVIGRLIDRSGAPAAHVPVVLVDDTGDGKLQIMLDGPPPETDDAGRFRLEGKPGKKLFVAMLQPPFRQAVVCEAGKTADLGDVQLAPPTPHRTPVN